MTTRPRLLILAFLLLSSCAIAQNIEAIQKGFQTPPDDSRIMMRWWWFGPSATKEEITAELQHMKAAGIGGVELQATYPMAVDDPANGFRNYRYLSPEFLNMVSFASHTAKELGLRMDLTIGSGWPYGGPYIPMELAATRLRMDAREIAPGRTSVARPVPYEGEHLIAAFIARGSLGETSADTFHELDLSGDGPIAVPKDDGPRTLVFFISSPTGQDVKRAALGAEGYVLDHYSQAAIETHLREAGDKLLGAADPGSIHAIFCDSLEVFDANWTSDLLSEFQRRRGYDLKPLLPLLEFDSGEKSIAVRRDYGRTLTEVFEARFLVPMHDWAVKNHVLFRMQNYGMPPASISSYRNVDLPEGEGFPWRKLTSARWAASAAHLFGKPVVSSETWTWLHSPAFRATPLDLKAEADLHFLMGINQLVGHGWPYSPPQAGTPGWTFYAAGALNDKNPWWPVMPDLSRYLQRMSYILRQGKPVVDVALYAPTEDVYATLKPVSTNYINLFERTGELIGPQIVPDILNAGFNFDVIDDGTLAEATKQHYKVVVLSGAHYIPDATKNWLKEFTRNGGVVVAVDQKPEGEWPGLAVVAEKGLSTRLASLTEADLKLDGGAEDIGHIHRQLDDADVYFLANTSNLPHNVHAQFRSKQVSAELWDPLAEKTQGLKISDGKIQLDLEPYASRVVIFRAQSKPSGPKKLLANRGEKDLSTGWTMTLPNSSANKSVNLPYSWSSEAATQFFSGTASFTKDITVSIPEAASHLYLDFGAAVPAEREALSAHTLRGYSFAALVTPPIREAATVFVNDQRAGSIWAPPYRIEITGMLKTGPNSIRVEVYNTAINELAEGGRLADINALTEHYGLRFKLQDFDDLKPLPSGVLSKVKLITEH
ncbi:MAG TPA: glycosyl hydrolase [Terriglobales bacterium]|nr:glycosyl hydrolase [Terriglobales bacterium]